MVIFQLDLLHEHAHCTHWDQAAKNDRLRPNSSFLILVRHDGQYCECKIRKRIAYSSEHLVEELCHFTNMPSSFHLKAASINHVNKYVRPNGGGEG